MATAYVQRPHQFYAEEVVSTTDAAGTIGKIGFDPGFLDTAVILYNDKADVVYAHFGSTVGSTGGFRLAAGGVLAVSVRTGGFSLASTTTSTGTTVRVLALGE